MSRDEPIPDASSPINSGSAPFPPIEPDGDPSNSSRQSKIKSTADWWDVPVRPIIAAAEAAYLKELDELIENHEGEWVAYHGGSRLGFSGSRSDLLREWSPRFPNDEIAIMLVDAADRSPSGD